MPNVWEVEQKYVVSDEAALRTRLAEAGYVLTGRETNSDIYFQHPCRDLRESGEAFRLRTTDSGCCVTYKGQRLPGAVKTRPEIELHIDAQQQSSWLELLQCLGFVPLPEVRKQRATFDHPAGAAATDEPKLPIQVTLDHVDQLGTFAELESLASSADQLPQASQQICQLASLLGLDSVQPKSYLTLMLELQSLRD